MQVEKIEETLAREEIELAPLWKRVVAHFIDDLLVSMVIIGLYWEKIAQNTQDTEAIIAAVSNSWLLLYVVRIIYHWLFVRYFGATIGKIVVKIRIIEVGLLDNPSSKEALFRSFLRALSEFLMYLPFLYILISPLRQGFHDKVANTIVVNLKNYNA
ncbi:MAG: RDD family protein [Helicobacter sp.]|nr:RDD family protein [Helicobacteraceae bacterium]MDY3112928.1 RDD family protein [Helicobacter sp.]